MSSAGGENDIHCTGKGLLPWHAPNGDTILITCYYSPQALETIVSPSDIVSSYYTQDHKWTQHADFSTNKGYIEFTNNNNSQTTRFPLTNKNNLWYYSSTNYADTDIRPDSNTPIIHRVTARNLYDLFHARLGHPGERVLTNIHHYVDGIPKLRKPDLYR